MSEPLKETSQIQLDIKTLLGIVFGIVSIAGIWFNLTAEIAKLERDVSRLQYNQTLNDESLFIVNLNHIKGNTFIA